MMLGQYFREFVATYSGSNKQFLLFEMKIEFLCSGLVISKTL